MEQSTRTVVRDGELPVRRLRTFERDSIAGLGLGPAQLFVLSRLAEREATSIRELADRTMTDPSSVSVVLSKLVSLGLVKKSVDPGDARRHVLSLSAKGRAALATAPVTPQAQLVVALEKLPVARRRAIVRALGSLVTALGAEATEPTLFFEDDAPRKRRSGTKHVRR